MRIIAGTLGGRRFEAPQSHRTHPMSDKVRGGLFNVLGDIAGLTVLDAFAGSGALSFEAVSRGARHVTATDIDRSAINTIVKGESLLGITDRIKAVRANVGSWSDNNPDTLFDIVLLDPPYDQVHHDLLAKLTRHTKTGGIIVYSLPPKAQVTLSSNFQLLSTKLYGDAQLVFYRRIS